jgi:hypothetical protein
MTHYLTDYTAITDELVKHNKAIEDIVDYMGKERFDKITAMFKEQQPQLPLEHFKLYCSLAGVEGYPVKAWYNYCYPL